MSEPTRDEHDTMGAVPVPRDAYWGASTERARANFAVGGGPIPAPLIHALGAVKAAFAGAHGACGVLSAARARAIEDAADEVAAGRFDAHFVVDVFQTGSGTSSNMNANEVIANRAAELLGHARGAGAVHANDDVNRGQSSNDVFPTAVHLAFGGAVGTALLPSMRSLARALHDVADRTFDVVTTGRTHLMDAMPIRFGQRFRGYADQVDHGIAAVAAAREALAALPLGGTAVGTGVNSDPAVVAAVIERLRTTQRWPELRPTTAPFQAQATADVAVAAMGALRAFASGLYKLVNDIRWMASGPLAGLAEVRLRAVQPGSSIMPAKVNPVICESVLMVCAQVIAHDQLVAFANTQGQFELNTMWPLIGRATIESATILAGACAAFEERCIAGLTVVADAERVARNPIFATALNERLGYDAAAAIAKAAAAAGRTVRDMAAERTDLTPSELDALLDAARLAGQRGRHRRE